MNPDTIFLRAYTEDPEKKPVAARPKDKPSEYTLIFDTETTVDAKQAFRVGFFQVRKSGGLITEGVFYDPDSLSDDEIGVMASYAELHQLTLGTLKDFRLKVLLRIGYEARASIVGFNLPFDLSRVAMSSGAARLKMRGGFSFEVSPDRRQPRIRVKHLSSTAAQFDFAVPKGQETPRGMRNRGLKVTPHRGYFIDLRALAVALTSRKHSLKSLCEHLNVDSPKLDTEEHGGPITPEYLDYARRDVQATWECHEKLKAKYAEHGLSKPLHRILSEASIGKAYLEEMGIKPLLACQPDMPRGRFGQIMSAYFGGRTEIRIRKEIREVIYTDFKSMYPTVNTLMGLWRFVIADGYTERDTTGETRAWLDQIDLNAFRRAETWPQLTTLVRLCPEDDVLPVRAKYTPDKDSLTIGLNHLTSEEPLWYTLADVMASKLLTGKTPQILEAVTFEPGPVQEGLKPISLFGNPYYQIDPKEDDMFNRVIDLRDDAKAKRDPVQLAMKILANSTCYGIFVEVNRNDAPKPEPIMVYGPDGSGMERLSKAIEQPGRYFNPLLATLITGAARLMLAITERLIADQELEWAFCDTDSMALARPEGMTREEFRLRAQSVIDWFEPLNPYDKAGSILQMEDVNYLPETEELTPLYAYAISSKRYALFNLDERSRPAIRKASAHGLGHLMDPYPEGDPAAGIPGPGVSLRGIGVKRWQYDHWFVMICNALEGCLNKSPGIYHPALNKPAIQRYGATSPALLRWMGYYNERKGYREQIKPFNFLVAPMARTGSFAAFEEMDVGKRASRGRPSKTTAAKPVAPFERDPAKAIEAAFDRVSGESVSAAMLKTYAEALALYHVSPEDKFENGGPVDVGSTQRRQVHAVEINIIGKEANKVGEAGQVDPISSAVRLFGGEAA